MVTRIIVIQGFLLLFLAGCSASPAVTGTVATTYPPAPTAAISEPTAQPSPRQAPTPVPPQVPTQQPTTPATTMPTPRPPAPTRAVPPKTSVPPTSPTIPSKGEGAVSTDILTIIKADLAKRTGTTVDAMRVLLGEAVEWNDSSLGCPRPGLAYMQVITSGYRVLLQVANQTYEYHTDTRGHFVLCEKTLK